MIDHDRVQHTESRDRREIRRATGEIVVLQVRVLEAHRPTGVERSVGRVQLLKDVRRDTNARPVAGRHAKGEVDALDVELVLVLRLNVVSILVVAVDDSGEIDRWDGDLSLRREHRRRDEQSERAGECR